MNEKASLDQVCEALARTMKVLRDIKGISLREHAEQIELSPATLCRVEQGKGCDLKTLVQIHRKTGVKLTTLLGEKGCQTCHSWYCRCELQVSLPASWWVVWKKEDQLPEPGWYWCSMYQLSDNSWFEAACQPQNFHHHGVRAYLHPKLPAYEPGAPLLDLSTNHQESVT